MNITIDRRYRGPTAVRERWLRGGEARGVRRRPGRGDAPAAAAARPAARGRRRRTGGCSCSTARPSSRRREPRAPELEPPALSRSRRPRTRRPGTSAWAREEFSECFTCGVRPDDGLCIHVGPVAGSDVHAAPWTAREVSPEVVWAAIDCPGAWAVGGPGRGEVVLGRMNAEIRRLPEEGEQCVVVAWPLGEDGRKLHAGTALFSAGRRAARARAPDLDRASNSAERSWLRSN